MRQGPEGTRARARARYVVEEFPENRYPLYLLRIAGGEVLNLHFTGDYPETLYLTISKGLRRTEQFSDARMAHVTLAVSMDANRLLLAILDGLNRFGH